ncbi:uncharacterized protein T551_03453 [Pneumocystis jirovecii RU7]|uniref:DNA replication regulator SLD2 n=1 Tax=Pneumocystis jirovecii (strain RU7) TaxID=1408657 RepID=A0A0W4ZDS3_PNEJ7|nr:uncharacterized protein T551_03453 [Pneumocystis jirovecii RU7]KTW26536.1 hypothetical protein T551_03453 [Pneumocystis jirovecii RU7]
MKEIIEEKNREIKEIQCKKKEEERFLKYRQKLREKLKEWEWKFKEQEGRYPKRDDIKKNKKIKEYYKLYNQIRAGKISLNQQNIEKIHKESKNKKDIDGEEGKDFEKEELVLLNGNCEEIGPTPQKIGKPIGIFDHFNDYLYISEEKNEVNVVDKNTENISKKSNNNIFQTPSKTLKTPDRNNFLTTPVFLRKVVDMSSPTIPRFSFRTSISKKGLSSLIEELRQMEDNFVDPGENVLKEIEEENYKAAIKSEKEVELIEKSDSENKTWKKRGIKRSRRVILRPSIKKQSKKQQNANTLINKKASKENHILYENKTLSNVSVQKEIGNDKKDKHKKYIKGKGGVILRSQVSRNYVSYKLKKYKNKNKSWKRR